MTPEQSFAEDLRQRVEDLRYPKNMPAASESRPVCECFHSCNEGGQGCSLSGDWHQHSDWPCAVHPEAEMTS